MGDRKRSIEEIAVLVLKHALEADVAAPIVGDVTAEELARLTVLHLTSCPACGAEPGCDISCQVCIVVTHLEGLESEEADHG